MNTPDHPAQHDLEGGFSTPVGSRRTFFGWTIAAISSIISLSLAIPLLGYVISPALKRRKQTWMRVGKVDDLQIGQPKDLEYAMTVKDGWRETSAIKAVWAVKQADNEVTVFSPICPHLGCGFRWDGQARQFQCPCHGSVYDIDGKVIGGPAPRPLDSLPAKVEDGQLLVIYKEFKSGLSKKVEL